MNYQLRLSEVIYGQIQKDLARPHPFALERIGFLSARSDASGRIFLGYEYVPVAENDYLPDDEVGAKIGSGAIRAALQRVLSTGDSVFHVHKHDHPGQTRMSRVDAKSLCELMPSFHSASPRARHGALILSQNEATAWIWDQESRIFAPVERTTIIGFPLKTFTFREAM